jgi:hypothetical protein
MTKKPPVRANQRKSGKQDSKAPRRESRALARVPRAREEVRHADRPTSEGRVKSHIDPLLNDLPAVTLKDEHEVLFHFGRIDPRLAEAWKRDVVVHEGPITLRRVMYPASFGGATHYAYVDRRLLWYLSHDPSDPDGARWDGYLASARDAPPGTTVVVVGRDIVVKKRPPQLGKGGE